MAPGVVMPQQDIGGSKLGSQIDYKSYGIPGQAVPDVIESPEDGAWIRVTAPTDDDLAH